MLLGAFIGSTDWVLDCLDSGSPPGFAWGQYSKHGSSKKSEGSTGADFALIIRFSDDIARASVFQAKRSDSNNIVNVHRIAPFRAAKRPNDIIKLPEPQILRLLSYGLEVAQSKNESDLDWLHYCAYGQSSFFCAPLNQAAGIISNYRNIKTEADKELEKLHYDKIKSSSLSGILKERARIIYKDCAGSSMTRNGATRELIHLLSVGASTFPEDSALGWLKLDSASAIDGFIKTFASEVNIVELRGTMHPKPSADATIINHLNNAAKNYVTASPTSGAKGKPAPTGPRFQG
ncbi:MULTISPECIES: hypothetical protein [Xanthomonas]|nr:hypothetical protein [Xanthomonas campestris]MCC5095370.1 hypothetical protein [Xanthomonas campestris pv. incanae]MEA9613158.1 hypothetical protein [Xanthomonas campestris pv. incanae]WDJ09147.1 hypothetical protein JH299_16315 [Xanthomonas campestris pv. incanae]